MDVKNERTYKFTLIKSLIYMYFGVKPHGRDTRASCVPYWYLYGGAVSLSGVRQCIRRRFVEHNSYGNIGQPDTECQISHQGDTLESHYLLENILSSAVACTQLECYLK